MAEQEKNNIESSIQHIQLIQKTHITNSNQVNQQLDALIEQLNAKEEYIKKLSNSSQFIHNFFFNFANLLRKSVKTLYCIQASMLSSNNVFSANIECKT